jgi:Immunoglobulin I-set domain
MNDSESCNVTVCCITLKSKGLVCFWCCLQTAGYQILNIGSLRIEAVDPNDAGVYVCVAQNSVGTAMNQVRLDVQGKTYCVCQQFKLSHCNRFCFS